MRQLKVHFPDPNHLTMLMNDSHFMARINHFTPFRLDDNYLVLSDSNELNDNYDSEMVILSAFADGIKKILFPKTPYPIEFIDPIPRRMKGGLSHNGERIIDSTDVQL